MYYYRVPVIEDEEGRRPDCEPPYSVVEYLDDETVIVKRPEPIDGLQSLTDEELNGLVKSPVFKVIEFAGKRYAFRPIRGAMRAGLDRDRIICLREEEEVEVPVAMDAEGRVLEKRKVKRTKLHRPPVDKMLALRNGKLVVVEEATEEKVFELEQRKRQLALQLENGEITKEQYDEEMAKLPRVEAGWLVYDDPEVEYPVVGGGKAKLKEIKTRWVG